MPGVTLYVLSDSAVYYDAGFSGSVTVPNDVTQVQVWLQAAGGAGAERSDIAGSAGGGGGFANLSRSVLVGEWGTTLTLAVGAGSLGANGGATTLSGTLNGASVSVTCNGGNKGTAGADGTGGTAIDGTLDPPLPGDTLFLVSGYDGTGYVASPPDERVQGIGGAGGGDGVSGALSSVRGDYGAGSDGALTGEGLPGGPGYAKFIWS